MPRRLLCGLVVLLAIVGCGGSDEQATPSDPPVTSESTTSTTPAEDVEAAYLESWDVYSEAVRELDPSGLADAYAEGALALVEAELERLIAAKTAIVVQVEHDIEVTELSGDSAKVRDRYVNRNYRVDESGEPLDDTNDPGTYVETYEMKRVDGTWRVTRIVRESYQP